MLGLQREGWSKLQQSKEGLPYIERSAQYSVGISFNCASVNTGPSLHT
jgi:hypothetical protein